MRLTPEEVGTRIRKARLARRWTHEELARRMDANWRTIQRWQKGQLPRLQTLLRLADVLDVPQSYFIEPEDSLATVDELRARVDDLTERVDALARSVEAQWLAQHETAHEKLARRTRRSTA